MFIGDVMKKILCVLFCLLLIFVFSGCQQVVVNNADELTMYSWESEFDNGTIVSLTFDENVATLHILLSDGSEKQIKGLCELSESAFVIHDSLTKKPYAFSYIVNFDRVEIVWDENTVSLYKSNY